MPPNLFALKAALRDIDAKGIEVGDTVTVTWVVPENYGGGTLSHTGTLKVLDRETGWFEVDPTNRSPGHLRSSIIAMGSRMEKSGTTDSKPATTRNLFMEKARASRP